MHADAQNTVAPGNKSRTLQCVSVEVWPLFFEEPGLNSSPPKLQSILRGGFGSVVWTTDSGRVGVRPFTSGFVEMMHAMSASENDSKLKLECLRLASDLRQFAKETLDPDLKAHCLQMAKHWSDQAEKPANDDTGVDEGLAEVLDMSASDIGRLHDAGVVAGGDGR